VGKKSELYSVTLVKPLTGLSSANNVMLALISVTISFMNNKGEEGLIWSPGEPPHL
jgi:hypothetical protein